MTGPKHLRSQDSAESLNIFLPLPLPHSHIPDGMVASVDRAYFPLSLLNLVSFFTILHYRMLVSHQLMLLRLRTNIAKFISTNFCPVHTRPQDSNRVAAAMLR